MHRSLLGIYTEKPACMSNEKPISGDCSMICNSNKAKQNNTNQLLRPPTEEQSSVAKPPYRILGSSSNK